MIRLSAVVFCAILFAATSAWARPAPRGPGSLLVLDFDGEIGRDITAAGVKEALDAALRNDITTVAIHLRSKGGSAAAGAEIAALFDARRDRLTALAFFERGEDEASLRLLAACDAVWFAPDARFGPFFLDGDDESARRVSTMLAAQCESAGLPAPLVRATIEEPFSLYTWTDRAGARRFSVTQPPAGAVGVERFDDPDTLLSIPAAVLEELGVARTAEPSPRAIAAAVGAKLHAGATAFAKKRIAFHALRAQREEQQAIDARVSREEREKELAREVPDMLPAIDRLMSRARAAEPRRHLSYGDRNSAGHLTSAGRRRWLGLIHDALAIWEQAAGSVVSLERAVEEARSLGIEVKVTDTDIAVRKSEIASEIARLRSLRNETRP